MGRTLYLNENRGMTVFRDGPSIRVEEKTKAGRRIPVRLVGRVIVIGNVRLDSGAITLFTENDIPVTFMNRRSEETAVAMPYNHRLPTHYEEQKSLLDSEENIYRYKEWADAKRALLQLNMIRRFLPALAHKLEKSGFGEGNYQILLKNIRRVNNEQWLVVSGIVNNLLREMIIESVCKAGLDPHLGVIHRRHNFGLVLDICYTMGGESDLQSILFFKSYKDKKLIIREKGLWVVTNEGIRNIVHRFENKRKELRNKIENIIDELFELIRELRI